MYSRAVAEVEKGISMKEQSRPLFVPHALSARRDCLRRRQWRRRGAGHMMRGEVALRPMKHGVPGLSSGVPHGRRLAAWASSWGPLGVLPLYYDSTVVRCFTYYRGTLCTYRTYCTSPRLVGGQLVYRPQLLRRIFEHSSISSCITAGLQ